MKPLILLLLLPVIVLAQETLFCPVCKKQGKEKLVPVIQGVQEFVTLDSLLRRIEALEWRVDSLEKDCLRVSTIDTTVNRNLKQHIIGYYREQQSGWYWAVYSHGEMEWLADTTGAYEKWKRSPVHKPPKKPMLPDNIGILFSK